MVLSCYIQEKYNFENVLVTEVFDRSKLVSCGT